MFEETFVLLDEIIADDKRKTTKKPTPINKKPTIKSKKKRKKKPIVNDVITKPKRKKTPQAANDDSSTAKIKHSLGSLQGKMSMKMDTSPDTMKFYKQSLSGFIKASPTGSDGALVHSEDDKKREDAAVNALKDGMKALDHKPEDIVRDSKNLAEEKKKNPEKPIADIINDHKDKKSMSKTALIIGGSVLAAGLFVGFAAISPGVAILAGMQVLDHAMSPEISGRILDHVLSKKDKDETGDEPEGKSNNNGEDTALRQSRRNTQQEDEAEERENGLHRQVDSILGDGVEGATKEILNTTRSDPKTAENIVKLTEDQLKKEANKPDMSPIEGKKAEVRDAWAKRAEEFSNKSRDSSLSEEERNEHKRAARIAAGISGAPDLQKSMLETYHSNNAKPSSEKQSEHGDTDKDDGDDDKYEAAVEHITKAGVVNKASLKKATGLSDDEIENHLSDMEEEGVVSKPDKSGNRKVLMTYDQAFDDEDEEPEDEPQPPKGKGKKVQSSEQSDLDACVELTASLDWGIISFNKESNSWLELAALLNYRMKTDGIKGNGQDDLDSLGPNHVEFFEPSPYFGEEPEYQPNDDGAFIDYAQDPSQPESVLDRIIKRYNVESLMDMNGDFTQTVKAPTYAALKLNPVSSRLLKDWCEKRGIKGVYPKHEFHITVCYSKDPIDYKPMVFTDGPKQVQPYKFDLLGREDDKKFVVLKLQKGFPHKRFEYAQSIGASHDFPEYLPHISISPPGHGMTQDDVDQLNKHIDDLKMPLLIDYEYMDELKAELIAALKNTKYELEVNDGDKSILDILLQIKKHSMNGHSFPVKIDEGHDETKYGVDSDGADKLISIKIDGKKLSRQEEKERLNKYKKEAVKAGRPFVEASDWDFDKQVLSKKQHSKHLVMQTEQWKLKDDKEYLKPVNVYYNNDGHYVGSDYDPGLIKLIIDNDIIPEKRKSDSNVCSVGFSPSQNKWFGWSHRAIHGFKIGDVVKKGDSVSSSGWTEEWLRDHPEDNHVLPVGFKAETIEDAKRMANAFAESVASYEEVTAISVENAWREIGKQVGEKFMKEANVPYEFGMIKNSLREKCKNDGKYPTDIKATMSQAFVALLPYYQSQETFDKIWNETTKVLGSDKYTFNALKWYGGTKKQPSSMNRLEDLGRIKNALALKDRFREQIKREPKLKQYQDLNQITFKQLEDLADILKTRTTSNQDKAGYEDSLIKSNQAVVMRNDAEWKVVIPKSEEAAKYYGRNTRWCTAGNENNMYLEYAKDGDLIVIIHKKGNVKYQLHFETEQFMNAKDEPLDPIGMMAAGEAIWPIKDKFDLAKTNSDKSYYYDRLFFNKLTQKEQLYFIKNANNNSKYMSEEDYNNNYNEVDNEYINFLEKDLTHDEMKDFFAQNVKVLNYYKKPIPDDVQLYLISAKKGIHIWDFQNPSAATKDWAIENKTLDVVTAYNGGGYKQDFSKEDSEQKVLGLTLDQAQKLLVKLYTMRDSAKNDRDRSHYQGMIRKISHREGLSD